MYGIKYILQFDSEKYNHACKILIKERDYSGDFDVKSLGTAPILRRDVSDSGIAGTSLELIIQADKDGELLSLYTVDNKLFLVEVYRDEVLIWSGYILPEKYSEPYVSAPYDVSVSATDGLGILKNIPYLQTGEQSLFSIIKYCCDQTSLPLCFEFSLSLLESSMINTESVLCQTSLNVITFEGKTCYEVLSECITSFDAVITQHVNRWLICALVDVNKGGYIYNNNGVKTGNPSTREAFVLGAVSDDCYPIGNLNNEIIPANKAATFIYDYNKRASFLVNYNFQKELEGWNVEGKAYYGYSVNDVRFVSISEYGCVYQRIDVEKTSIAMTFSVNYCSSTNPIYWGGYIPETGAFNITIKLTDGATTKYLSLEEGWRDSEYSFSRSSITKKLQMFQNYPFSETDFEKLEITADGFPFTGKLEIRFQDTTNLANVKSHLTNVVVTHIIEGGIDVNVQLVNAASESYGEMGIAFGDTPFTENADMLFNNVLHVKNGGFTSKWSIGNKEDSFLYTILKCVCSRIEFPRRQLSGTIQGQNLYTFMLLVDKYSDSLFYIKESSLNLLTDEMDVTLEQFMPYIELSGETTESERTTNNSASEYRSSGENEVRVYQSGSGVPMRIKDLSPIELQPDSVIEVDRNNTLKSGKATLKKLLEFILTTGEVWTKEELKMVEGYLLYLGEKIKAGDSDLWEGHHFGDYLNQAVKTGSDVEFKSVLTKILTMTELTTPGFVSGILGSGSRLKNNHLELDEITVRKRMNVFQLVIQKVMHQGGILILSPGGAEITTVVDGGGYYKCTYDTKGGKLKQPFVEDDQLLCQAFDDGNTKRYWRRVTSVGEDYFNLSKTDCETNSGIPATGDEVVVLGNRTNVARQSALILQSVGADAPYMDTYDGINTFSLDEKLCTREGNLSGIVDEVFGQLGGTGLYAKRVYLRGKFALDTGGEIGEKLDNLEDNLVTVSGRQDAQEGNITEIRTKVEALPGQITQEVSGVVDWTKKEIDTAIAETITSIAEEYYLSTSATLLIGGSWVTTPPVWVDGKFVWTRSLITYADDTTTTTSPVCVTGATGATGPKGETGPTGSQGIPGTSQYFHVKYSANSNGNPMVDTPSTYIGTAVTSSATAPTGYASYKWVQLKGSQGPKGDQGIKGPTGANGVSSYLHIKYSDNGTTFTANGGETPGAYIGQYVDSTPADSTTFSAYTWTKVKGEKGDKGATGATGAAGKGVKSTAVTYQSSTSGTTVPTGTWSTSIPSVAANSYLWTRTIITYTDNTTSTSYAIGKMGATGATGVAGKGISSTAVTYQASVSGTTVPTGTWATSIPSVAANQYLWARTVITYTDKTTSTAYSIGKMGATGAAGAAGKGVKSTAVTYQASTSGITTPTGTWNTTIPSVAANSYLWTRAIITYTDNTTSTFYSIGKMGATGATGATGKGVKSTAVTYQSSTSGTTVPTGTWSSTIPSVAANSYLWTRTIITYTDSTTSTSYSIGKMGATGAIGSKGDTGAQGIPGESLYGKMLNRDPEFRKGANGVSMYNNTSGGNVTVTRIARPSDCPTTSGYCLKIKTAGAASPGCGGFVLSIQSRANAVFIQKIIAKIPVGYTITNASNSMGTGYTDGWLTSRAGTGKYETYLRKVVCGASGSFSSGGHVYLSGTPTPTASAPLEWYLAYCTVFDQTQDEGIDNLLAVAKSEVVAGIKNDSYGITLYAKQTDFNALGTRVGTAEATIKTQASNIELKVSKNGVVAAINASPETVKISAAKIDLVGKVTFSMLDTSTQSTINGKITSAQATTIVNTLKNSLGSLAYLSKVEQAQLGTTLIEGGYIKTSLIRTDLILSAGAEIGEFKIGDINGKGGRWLTASNNSMGLSGAQLAFNKSDRIVYVGSHPSEGTGGVPILGYFNIGPISPTLKSTEKCALYAAAPLHSSYLIKSYALYAESGSVRILNGGFGGMVRSFSLSGSSATIESNFLTGSINSATSGMVVKIQPGFEGQRIALLNYSGVGFSIYRNDRNSLATKIPSECSALLYYTGSTWIPVQVGNLYYT